MNITALLHSYNDKSGEQFHNMNTFVAKSIFFVIHEIFLKSAPSFVLSLSCRNNHTCNFYNDLIEKLFRMWDPTVLQLVVAQRNTIRHIDGDRLYNLILTDSYDAFLDLDIIFYTANYNVNEFYYIFLQTRDHLIPQEMQKILEYCWTNYIINCNVHVQTVLGEMLVYTYFPFTAQQCGKVVPTLINQYKNESFFQRQLFPNKLKNMYNCPLKAALWNVAPFVFLHTKNNKTSIERGFEGVLLYELSSRLNFSIEILIPPNDEQRGTFIGNNTNGALRMLMERTADLSLGSFRLNAERQSVVTSTVTYYITKQVLTVCDAAYAFSSDEILMFPFTNGAWFSIFLVFVMGALQVSFINRIYKGFPNLFPQHSPRHSYLNILLIFIGMPATRLPVRFKGRLFLLSLIFFTLVIRTVYQALLFHLIRTHITHNAPSTFEELVRLNYTAVMNIQSYDSLLDISFLEKLHKFVLKSRNETVAFSYIENLTSQNLVAIGPLDFLLYYARKNHKAGVFNILPQDANSFQVVMYLTKHSFLIDQFNEELLWMQSVGLIQIWSQWELDYKYFIGKHLQKNVLFSLQELYMIFISLGSGLCLACFLFLLEILSRKFLFLRHIFNNI